MMLHVQMSPSVMELLPLVCLCLLTLSGSTFADGNEPVVIRVKEGSDVTLPCSLSTNILSQRFEWKKDGQKEVFLYEGSELSGQDEQFKGRVSHFETELKNGNASITISNTRSADSGVYTCNIPSLHQIFNIKLLVGACPQPYLKILGETKGGVQLQCDVLGASPGFKLNIYWQDSFGTKLTEEEIQDTERGAIYILNITVTKSGYYHCVATMEEISHQVYTETHVYVPDGASKNRTAEDTGSSSQLVLPWVIGAVLLIALIAAVVYICKKNRRQDQEEAE